MAKRNAKGPMPAEAPAIAPASPFRWPSRRRADEAERAASRAAKAGLERLRARALRLATPPPPAEENETEAGPEFETYPDLDYATDPELEYETDPELEYETEPVEYETDPGPDTEPEPEREPTPALWDEELDELTERLVAELRRDLGPEPS
jgi:hypothetical protein